ncbi:MAG: hypothetical protein ACI9WU_003867, partial [Myxococcota bacterium]
MKLILLRATGLVCALLVSGCVAEGVDPLNPTEANGFADPATGDRPVVETHDPRLRSLQASDRDSEATRLGDSLMRPGDSGAQMSVARMMACPAGTWGATCASECPGGAASPCNGNGVCDEGDVGDGTCSCAVGWYGPACAAHCPGSDPA